MSEFLERKAKTFFRRFDSNNDGFITREDFEQAADRACEGESDDSPRRKETREKYTKFFSFFEPMGSSPGKVTEKEWLDGAEKLRCSPAFKTNLQDSIPICFALMDTNGDGHIQEAEYIWYLKTMAIPDHVNVAKDAFKGLDANGDGELSLEEFGVAINDFFFSEDDKSPGTLTFGPLIQ